MGSSAEEVNGDGMVIKRRSVRQLAVMLATLIIVARAPTCLSSDTPDSGVHIEPQVTLANPEQALARALEYTGFDKAEGYSKSSVGQVKLVTGHERKTLFVSGLINDRQVWSVIFRGIPVRSDLYLVNRDFEVILDPITGQLLQIVSAADDVGSSDTLPEPPAQVGEDYLKRRDLLFNGIPAHKPAIGFWGALAAVFIHNPARSKVVKGVFVDYVTNGVLYPQRWLIIIRGSESPLIAAGRTGHEVPLKQRNSMLCVVDGTTGNFEYVINAPVDKKVLEDEYKKKTKK